MRMLKKVSVNRSMLILQMDCNVISLFEGFRCVIVTLINLCVGNLSDKLGIHSHVLIFDNFY